MYHDRPKNIYFIEEGLPDFQKEIHWWVVVVVVVEGLMYFLNVREWGYQNQTSTNEEEEGSKFWPFCEKV